MWLDEGSAGEQQPRAVVSLAAVSSARQASGETEHPKCTEVKRRGCINNSKNKEKNKRGVESSTEVDEDQGSRQTE